MDGNISNEDVFSGDSASEPSNTCVFIKDRCQFARDVIRTALGVGMITAIHFTEFDERTEQFVVKIPGYCLLPLGMIGMLFLNCHHSIGWIYLALDMLTMCMEVIFFIIAATVWTNELIILTTLLGVDMLLRVFCYTTNMSKKKHHYQKTHTHSFTEQLNVSVIAGESRINAHAQVQMSNVSSWDKSSCTNIHMLKPPFANSQLKVNSVDTTLDDTCDINDKRRRRKSSRQAQLLTKRDWEQFEDNDIHPRTKSFQQGNDRIRQNSPCSEANNISKQDNTLQCNNTDPQNKPDVLNAPSASVREEHRDTNLSEKPSMASTETWTQFDDEKLLTDPQVIAHIRALASLPDNWYQLNDQFH